MAIVNMWNWQRPRISGKKSGKLILALLILQPFRHFTYVTAHSPTLLSLYLHHNSLSNPSVALPTSQIILQSFCCFTYVTAHSRAHSLTLPLLHLRQISFSNHSFASPTSQAFHLIHLASRPCDKGQLVARMPADHAWCTITGADETKWMRRVWKNGGMKYVARKNGRNVEEKPTQSRFFHDETHLEWPRRKLETPAVVGERLTACVT